MKGARRRLATTALMLAAVAASRPRRRAVAGDRAQRAARTASAGRATHGASGQRRLRPDRSSIAGGACGRSTRTWSSGRSSATTTSPAPAGQELVPDLAVRVPAPTNGGRTYRFTLKRGIRFGPPVNRKIVSTDIKYAIERLARPRNVAVYCGAVQGDQGFDAYRAGKARSISGITTPNPRTIVFTLTPAGRRLPAPRRAAGGRPDPARGGAVLRGRPGLYSGDLVASGPYMIEGAGAVRLGSCAAIKPMRGISQTQLVLVRNPSYDPRTDSRAARENNPDRFVFLPVRASRVTEIVRKLTAGELEDALLRPASSPGAHRQVRRERAQQRGALRLNSAAWLHYISMNLTRPPFDDVHVRRALSWVVDKAALRDAFGGPAAGPIAGTSSRTTARRPAGGLRAVQDARRPRQPRAREGRDGEVEVHDARRRLRRQGLQARPHRARPRHHTSTLASASPRCSRRTRPRSASSSINRAPAVGRDVSRRTTTRCRRARTGCRALPDPSNFIDLVLRRPEHQPDGTTSTRRSLGITPAQAERLGVEGPRRRRAERRRRHRAVQRARRHASRSTATPRSTGS